MFTKFHVPEVEGNTRLPGSLCLHLFGGINSLYLTTHSWVIYIRRGTRAAQGTFITKYDYSHCSNSSKYFLLHKTTFI
jgi:hypothetical protein